MAGGRGRGDFLNRFQTLLVVVECEGVGGAWVMEWVVGQGWVGWVGEICFLGRTEQEVIVALRRKFVEDGCTSGPEHF